jgi:hypothetical protein
MRSLAEPSNGDIDDFAGQDQSLNGMKPFQNRLPLLL